MAGACRRGVIHIADVAVHSIVFSIDCLLASARLLVHLLRKLREVIPPLVLHRSPVVRARAHDARELLVLRLGPQI